MGEDYDMHIEPPDKAVQLSKLSTNLVKLAPTNAETHAALAIVHFLNEWKWKEAEDEFKEALELAKVGGLKVYKVQREALLKKYFSGGGPETSTTSAELMEEA